MAHGKMKTLHGLYSLSSKVKQSMEEKQIQWENLSPEEKKKQLFLKQKELLDTFLERNAISQSQYDKSLGDLRDKMGMQGMD